MRIPKGGSWVRDVRWLATVAACYFAIARLSLLFVTPEGIAALWPPAGVFLAALLLTREDLRPGLAGALLVTDFVAELLAGTPPVVSAVYAAALAGDAVLGVWLLRRFVGEPVTFRRVREVIAWLLLSVLLSNGSLSLVAAAGSTLLPVHGSFWHDWRWWATSDAVGNLVVTPLLLTWAAWVPTRRAAEAAAGPWEEGALFLGSAAATFTAFVAASGHPLFMLALPYLVFPFLVWAALRVGERGVATVLFVLASIVVPFVASGYASGLSFAPGVLDDLMNAQVLLAGSAIPMLILSAVVTERREATAARLAAEHRHGTTLRSIGDAVITTDTQGRVEIANPVAEKLTGWTEGEALGRPIEEVFHIVSEETGLRVPDPVDRVLREGRVVGLANHTLLLSRDGTEHPIADSAAPIRSEDEGLLGVVLVFRDRSEERRAAEALQRSRAILESVLEGTTDAVFVKDLEGRYLMVNAAGARMTGKAAQDLVGKDDTALFPPAEARDVMEGDRAVMAEGVTQTYEEVVTLGGETRTFLATKGPLRDETGKVIGLFGIARDITERKRAEEALRENEYFFRESQRAARIGSYRIDFRTRRWRSSEALDQILGIDAGYERTVSAWLSVIHPDDQAMMTRHLQEEVLGRGHPFDKEYRIVRKSNGEVRWVHALGAVELTPDGSVASMTGTIQDVTEHRRAEAAARESERRLTDILASMGDWVWEVDENGVYTYSSPQGEALFGDVLGRTPFDLMPPDEAARVLPIFTAIAEKKAPIRNLGNWNVKKDGEAVYLLTSGVPILDEHGNLRGYRGVDKDITERQHAEEERAQLAAQLTQAQKMESVGRLAGGVAHDFNNMLGVILGNAELALGRLEPDDPVRADFLEIQTAAARSADLTRQLLAFARKQTAAPRVLDLNETVAGMLKMLQRLIGEDIDLRWRPEFDLWPVEIDPSQVDQILANLCVNARDAIAGVGTLTIETARSTLGQADCAGHPELVPGEYVVLEVSDDGAGMDAETLSHVFEPFFTTKETGRGTGLGLAMVYGIVKQNNGFIDVRSEPGRGTTFRIHLPRHRSKAASGPIEVARGDPPRGTETILVAEDEAGIRKLVARMLTRHGYTVLVAATPGEAIRLAREHLGEIHLLVTDVVMPEMNGRDLAKNLQALYPDLRRLFMSGYTADVIAHRGVLDEGVFFLQKPFSAHDLAAKVREALDHGRTR